jgi:hypothetical protein
VRHEYVLAARRRCRRRESLTAALPAPGRPRESRCRWSDATRPLRSAGGRLHHGTAQSPCALFVLPLPTFAAVVTRDALAFDSWIACVELRLPARPVEMDTYAIQPAEKAVGPAPGWLLSGAVPPGVSLDRDGLVHGTPTQAGTWAFWIELSDEDPPSATWCRPTKSEREFIVTVAAPPGTVGSAYSVQMRAEGVGAQTWVLGSGTLPLGLALSQTTGMITGTPAIPGVSPLKLLATDSRGVTVTVEVTIVVHRSSRSRRNDCPPESDGRPGDP